MRGRAQRLSLVALGVALVAASGAALAQPATPRSWSEEKCDRYRQAWTFLQAHRDLRGIGPDFLQRHEAFLGSGCSGPHDVCPRSPEEINVANALTIAAMNAGTASTFPPFGCPR